MGNFLSMGFLIIPRFRVPHHSSETSGSVPLPPQCQLPRPARVGNSGALSRPLEGRGLTEQGRAEPRTGSSNYPSQSGAAQSGRVGHVTRERFPLPLPVPPLAVPGGISCSFLKNEVFFWSVLRRNNMMWYVFCDGLCPCPLKWSFAFWPPPTKELVSPSRALGAAAGAASLAGGIPPLWGEQRWTVELE